MLALLRLSRELWADPNVPPANLQIPYLLNLAVLSAEFLPLFKTTSRSLHAAFRILSKLDYAFASLLTGLDLNTGEPLPGFEGGRTVSTTDKVRLKGIVERTRLIIVRVTNEEVTSSEFDEEDWHQAQNEDTKNELMQLDNKDETYPTADPSVSDTTVVFEGFENNHDDTEDEAEEDDKDEHWERTKISSVYKKTIDELGDVLGGPPIGIVTEEWGIGDQEQQEA